MNQTPSKSSIQVFPLNNGILKGMPQNIILNGSKEVTMDLPVWTVLIQASGCNILFDTAMSRFTAPANTAVTEQEALPAVLRQHGLTPDDIDYVVCSHLHFDHSGYLELFTKPQIIVSAEEYRQARRQYEAQQADPGYMIQDIQAWFSRDRQWTLIEDSPVVRKLVDGVSILNLGRGHAYGMLGLLLELPETGNVILSADVVYCRKNTEGPSTRQNAYIDREAYQQSYDRLMALADQYHAQIWYGHDMEQVRGLLEKGVFQ